MSFLRVQLGEVDECVRKWREGVMREIGRLEEREKSMRNRVRSGVRGGEGERRGEGREGGREVVSETEVYKVVFHLTVICSRGWNEELV